MLGTHQDTGIGVCQKMKKKRQKNYAHEHETFLCLVTDKNFFLSIKFDPHLILRAQINITSWIITIPDHLKTQEMCNEAVRTEPLSLTYVPDCFKTQEMCNNAVRNKLCMMLFVPDHFWMQEMCNEIMSTLPDAFHRIPDCFKTQKMCIKTVEVDFSFFFF